MIPSFLERWLIAGCVERARSFPDWLRRRLESSPALRRYAHSLSRVESALTDATSAPTCAPSPELSRRIADALAAHGAPARRALPLGRLGAGFVGVALLLSLLVLVRPGRHQDIIPRLHGNESVCLPSLPSDLRRGPVILLADSVERPWRTLTSQTRQSISGFIRALPGLPLGDSEPSKTQ